MIGCDACDRWYHGPCVGVDKKAADQMTEYVCLFCCRKSGTPYKYGPPEPVPKMTRRPRLRQVAALIDEADKIPLSIPEVEPMRRLMSEPGRPRDDLEASQAPVRKQGCPRLSIGQGPSDQESKAC